MNLLILPGNSARHREWLQDARAALAPYFDEIRVLEYTHWGTGRDKTDVQHEIGAAGHLTKGWVEYIVLAKSIGTIVALLASQNQSMTAHSYIFLGLPLQLAIEDTQITELLKTVKPITIIQNSHDPFGSADDVRVYARSIKRDDIQVVKIPGDTHDYLDFSAYVKRQLLTSVKPAAPKPSRPQ